MRVELALFLVSGCGPSADGPRLCPLGHPVDFETAGLELRLHHSPGADCAEVILEANSEWGGATIVAGCPSDPREEFTVSYDEAKGDVIVTREVNAVIVNWVDRFEPPSQVQRHTGPISVLVSFNGLSLGVVAPNYETTSEVMGCLEVDRSEVELTAP